MDLKDFFASAERASVSQAELDQWIERNKTRAERELYAFSIIRQLRESWYQWDPGKTEHYVFFVRDYRLEQVDDSFSSDIAWCDAFFARELVNNLPAAEKGVDRIGAGPFDKTTAVPLGDLREAKREPCLDCNQPAFVLGWHRQNCDSPYGDTWVIRLFHLCPHCAYYHPFSVRTSEHRLTSRLKPPQE